MHEANIQAELYHRLRLLGYPVYVEQRIISKLPFRADLCVGVGSGMLLIEVKARPSRKQNRRLKTLQYRKYLSSGIPTIYVCGWYQIEWAMSVIKDFESGNEFEGVLFFEKEKPKKRKSETERSEVER